MRTTRCAFFLAALTIAAGASSGSAVAQSSAPPAQARDLAIEATPPAKPARRPASANIPVQVGIFALGSTTIQIGQPIRFQVSSNSNSWGHVYVANTSGQVYLLAENIKLGAEQQMTVPKQSLTLRATAPAGDNTVIFVATRKRFPGFAGGKTTTAPKDIQINPSELQGRLDQRLSIFDRADWGLTRMTIRVVP